MNGIKNHCQITIYWHEFVRQGLPDIFGIQCIGSSIRIGIDYLYTTEEIRTNTIQLCYTSANSSLVTSFGSIQFSDSEHYNTTAVLLTQFLTKQFPSRTEDNKNLIIF